MDNKFNDLKQQIEILAKRVQKAIDNESASTIEIDIMMEQLRNTYVIAEEIRELIILSTKSKSPYIGTAEEISEARAEVKHPEILVTVPPMPPPPKVEQIIPDSPAPEPEEPFILPGEKISKPDIIVEIPNFTERQDLPFTPSPVPIEEIPVMRFREVEVEKSEEESPHIQSNQMHSEKPGTTPVYSAPTSPSPTHEPVHQSYYTAPDQAPVIQNPQKDHQSEISSGKSNDLFGSHTLADKFKKETPSLNEKIIQGREDQTLAHRMQLKPISDLKTAIGINEKFQLVNDLFQGRIELYNDAINRLNTCGSSYSAEGILEGLKSSHNWKEEAEAYGKLRTFITRRYL